MSNNSTERISRNKVQAITKTYEWDYKQVDDILTQNRCCYL